SVVSGYQNDEDGMEISGSDELCRLLCREDGGSGGQEVLHDAGNCEGYCRLPSTSGAICE
ncbi:hypothetical protein P7K49_000273, partial [Saguinus oedipus]